MSDNRCPGCRVLLPAACREAPAGPTERHRLAASSHCWQALDRVAADVLVEQRSFTRCYQTVWDAFIVQHAGPSTQRLSVFFALNTLYLVLERGFSSIEARQAHRYLAETYGTQTWPAFDAPRSRGSVTVHDVAAETGDRETTILSWGAAAWAAWSGSQDQVRTLTDEHLRDWRPSDGAAKR